jgi:hypothetical protein
MMTTKTPETNNKVYFTEQTQDAIIAYNESLDSVEREKIYIDHIQYPLNKLAENVINRFKFPYLQQTQSFEETKRQVISYLAINLAKYTKDKGKAFSYFSVIAKNYLILHNNNAYTQQKRSISLYDCDSSNVSIEEMLSLEAPDERRGDDVVEFVALIIDYWQKNVNRIFKKQRDADIAMAVVELMKNANGIENFNKKALYIMIREITNCKTSYITRVVNKMRDITAYQYEEFMEYGTVGRRTK